ncbi:MAG: hypothetical protein JW839_15045 [Candidatus Lokiarchaeota archaeon]|nr:hypothetical protein [Candidatus Lokiarchaeota archaeon]
MADRKGSLAGVAILSILVGAGLGFGLTWLLPPSGGVLHTHFLSLRTLAYKNDDQVTKTLVPGTQLNITTSGFSYITVEFTGSLGYHLDATFVNTLRYNITLEVDGAVVAEHKASWHHSPASGVMEEGSLDVSMAWVSGTLAAGAHTVRVMWVSDGAVTGANQIYFSTTHHNATRSLTIQEIRFTLY